MEQSRTATDREVWPPEVPARSAGLALVGCTGHVAGVLLVMLLVGCVLVTAEDLRYPDIESPGFGILLGWLVACGVVGLGAPLLTFRGVWQHLVMVSVPTFALVSGMWREPPWLVGALVVSAVCCLWAAGLRAAHLAPSWTFGDWWARAWLVGVLPAMVAGSSIWGGLGPGDRQPDDRPADLLAVRFSALGEAMLALGPSALLAMAACQRTGVAQRMLLGGAAVASLAALAILRSGLHLDGA